MKIWRDSMYRRAVALANELHHARRLIRHLEAEVSDARRAEAAASAELTRSQAEFIEVMEEARSCLLQARRDAELLALMARDRNEALTFLRDAHRIDGLAEPEAGAA